VLVVGTSDIRECRNKSGDSALGLRCHTNCDGDAHSRDAALSCCRRARAPRSDETNNVLDVLDRQRDVRVTAAPDTSGEHPAMFNYALPDAVYGMWKSPAVGGGVEMMTNCRRGHARASHTRTVVRECFKGYEASQWKISINGVPCKDYSA